MADDTLFQRGHILTRIGGDTDDFDSIIADHYFLNVLNLTGEVVDSEGSEYSLISLEGNQFNIIFTVYANEFVTDDDKVETFEELVVQCTGIVIQENETDILYVTTYNVLSMQ